jgi:diguanylate cyclase (GGDEF)-like protein
MLATPTAPREESLGRLFQPGDDRTRAEAANQRMRGDRDMKFARRVGLRQKVLWSVGAACTVIIGSTIALTRLQIVEIDRTAALQAAYVARSMAYAASTQSQSLQRYVEGMGQIDHLGAFIVDESRRVVADVNQGEVGTLYKEDAGGEIGRTLKDGITRIFVERNAMHPDGASQVVVPLRAGVQPDDPIAGALVYEYNGIRDDLERESLWRICAVAVAGLAGALVVGVFGLRLGNAIASRLSRLQAGVNQMAAGLYDTRLEVDGADEIGTLQGAFNQMAGDLQENHRRITADMEREKVATQQIEHLAYYDKLTDLPNRSLFSRLLERGIADARERRRHLAVMFIDLDRFKNINDTLGHDAGDSLLKEVAARTKAMLRETDVVCRLGGDEFVVLLNALDRPETIAAIAPKILAAISAPYRFADHELRVTASIGISLFPIDGSDEASLMKHADIAMYQAKQDGKNTFAFYADDLNTHSVERLAFESSLRHALDEGRFEIHYQPKVECVGGRMTGVEALLRWRHPDLGLVPPNKFIPIAEETGLIVPIGRWVLETACRQQVEWRRRGIADLTMAVNISGRQFADEHLLVDVDAVLASTGIDPSMLEIEITESVLMRDIRKGVEVLAAFKQRGIRLSIDDFGTGYSSLSTLKRFPIDSLKVDRSFVRELAFSVEDRAIADAIIAMGSTLGLTIVAEGVETAAQVDFLREHGCNEMQGFFFSRAIPADEIEELLASQPTGVLEGVDLTPSEHRQAADSAFVAFI